MKKTISIFLILMMVFSFVSCTGENEVESTAEETMAIVMTEEPKESSAPVETTKKVSFLAVGDNIIHECVYLDAMTVAASVGSGSDYYFDGMYADVEEAISGADIAFVNAEGPLNTEYKASGYPAFNAPAEAGDALVNMGFDIINLANNHMLDLKKEVGLQGTIDYWKDKPVVTVGGHENRTDYNSIRVLEHNGIRIAVLSYTYGTNGISLDDGSDMLIPIIGDGEIIRQIGEAREISDFVVVSMHWGSENTFSANAEQKRLAQVIADAQADVIIGHHSHTIQPVEWVTGVNGNKTLVYYSLGNFLHTQLKSYNLVGGVAMFNIVKEPGEKAHVEAPTLVPTVCHYTANTAVKDSLDLYKRENVKIYWLSEYTEELAGEHGSQNWNFFNLNTLKGYVKDTIPAEFLPDTMK